MSFNIILFKIMFLACFSCCLSTEVSENIKSEKARTFDLMPSETNAKLFNLGSLFGYPNYPNVNRPVNGFYPIKYPEVYPDRYYPNNNNYYPSTHGGTNILGGGYGGYGGYGGNGGLRQYYGYWDPNYVGHRNRGYGYYQNSNTYGFV